MTRDERARWAPPIPTRTGRSARRLPFPMTTVQIRTLRAAIAGEQLDLAGRHTRGALERRGLLADRRITPAGEALLNRWDRT